jgi:hypothetical protein
LHFPFQIVIWHTLAAERGFLHSLEGFACVVVIEAKGSYQTISGF